jgi:hypothetical protein
MNTAKVFSGKQDNAFIGLCSSTLLKLNKCQQVFRLLLLVASESVVILLILLASHHPSIPRAYRLALVTFTDSNIGGIEGLVQNKCGRASQRCNDNPDDGVRRNI